jgi:hypothetical protein
MMTNSLADNGHLQLATAAKAALCRFDPDLLWTLFNADSSTKLCRREGWRNLRLKDRESFPNRLYPVSVHW